MFNILTKSLLRNSINLARRTVSIQSKELFALSRANFSQNQNQESQNAQENTEKVEKVAEKVEEQVSQTATEDIKADKADQTTSAPKKPSFMEYLSTKAPAVGKVTNFVVDSWEQTFPSDKYKIKAELAKKLAKEQAEREREQKIYTEEELEQIQEEIPDWKRTSLAQYSENVEEDSSIASKVGNKIKEKFNQTRIARKLYQTEQYKEYEDFKKEMSQFREDLKDHLSQSQNPAMIASMTLIGKATSESSTAMAIKEMRKYQKDFDVFNLERDVRGIFVDIFNAYLAGDLSYIEKTCEDAGLAYFKTMLKKREVDGVIPKHTELWESEPADFIAGRISERNLPSFSFTLRLQEIHCYLSKKTGKIVDGSEDRLLQNRYNISISLAENPDLENVGHQWVVTEVIPVEAVLMLA